ncbi:MAG: cytochrome P450 [Myxococcota bacterium]|nr:cytochrome P450 [Myxococcota bacterium]
MADLHYDPYDYEVDADPHPTWRRMRDEAPLYRNDEFDFYALSRFHDVLEASLDAATYSSAYGTVLDLMQDEPGLSPMMIFQDAPEHTRLRKLVSRAFSPRRIAELEPRIRDIARGYLEPLRDAASFDYVADFGAKLPVMVIGAMLGVPVEDQGEIRELTDEMLHRDPEQKDPMAHHERITQQLFGYFARYIADRRARPRDDMMTDLVQAEIEGEDGSKQQLSDEQILAFISLLSGAGNETVARLLGWVGVLFARHPGERRRLVEAPERIPNAVEELLRYEAPSPVQARRTMRDTEWHGHTLPAGSKLLLLTGSAGRDDRKYPDPDRFDVTRQFDRHVALGYGAHFCIGASLARMEGRVAIEETLRLFPQWEIDEVGLERVHTSTVRGFSRVPIRF